MEMRDEERVVAVEAAVEEGGGALTSLTTILKLGGAMQNSLP